ncbi:YbaL family putative K(+) efflux transporter [Phenylobacterium sp.]|uniref:YbaL family putative K(+) efflux transporter n=1 Tax=Phenylobacterium sp. TaxID=1871053 RepID=UPI0030F426A7
MPHHTPLIATIVAGLTLAFAFGALAHRVKVSPLVGYLLAGVIVGPFTPGYVADQGLATELAEIGVILLMFGVGLHFSLKDLMSVRTIAIPGALGQMTVATLLGMGLGHLLGWSLISGLVFGLALSVASTVVLLRALQERRIVQTDRGRIAVGWLIVEDLAMVLALVLLPALAGGLTDAASGPADPLGAWIVPLGVTILKVAGFAALMLVVGRRVIPWLLHWTAHTGSRELFRLAVLAIALGVAFGAASLFGVSFALGAFFAGMILAESELSQRAAEESLPLRDAFAVLFFVSVGMLFNPAVLIEQPWALLATVAIIVVGKSMAAFAIVRLFKYDTNISLTISASLAQIGEFSFILAGLGVGLGLLPEAGRDLILAGAIISIILNPFLFNAVFGLGRVRAGATETPLPIPANDLRSTALSEHVIVVGFGQVGRRLAEGLEIAGRPFLIVDLDDAAERRARDAGFEVVNGNAADARVLTAAGDSIARSLVVTIPNGFEAGGVVEEARRANPELHIIARAHSDAEAEHLRRLGADQIVLGERELADAMLHRLRMPEVDDTEASPSAPEGERLLLADPEWALLAAARASGLAPGDTISAGALMDAAGVSGAFDVPRLHAAIAHLVEQDYFVRLGEERLRITLAGYAASAQAPSL